MRSTTIMAGALTALVLGSTAAQAQRVPRSSTIAVNRGDFAIAPYGGYLVSQTFFEGPIGTELNVQSAPLFGVQASLPLAPGASLVGSIAHASGDLDIGVPILGGVAVGTGSTTLFDASVELRMGSERSRFLPVVQLGGGAIQRKVTVAGVDADATDFQVSGALGADFPVTSNLSVRVMAKDHWGKADFGSVGPLSAKSDDLHAVALMGGVRFTF